MPKMIEVPDDVLEQAMRMAPADSPEQVVVQAPKEYAQRHGQASLIQHLGTFEDFMTLEELEEMRRDEH